jgi:hypothetical protein
MLVDQLKSSLFRHSRFNKCRFRAYCWSCGKDKPRAGGREFGRVHYQKGRFKCADCIGAVNAA